MYLVDYGHVKNALKFSNIAELHFLARRETPVIMCITNWYSCAGTMVNGYGSYGNFDAQGSHSKSTMRTY